MDMKGAKLFHCNQVDKDLRCLHPPKPNDPGLGGLGFFLFKRTGGVNMSVKFDMKVRLYR